MTETLRQELQPHEAVIAIEQKKNLEVGGGDFQAFVGLASALADPVDCTVIEQGSILGNDHRKSLHAALGPVVDAGKDGVLMVEMCPERRSARIEREVLWNGRAPCISRVILATPLAKRM